jgi:hypothetical protein
MTGYTKLFHSIVTSTIWQADDKTRIVWITLLALSDKDGMVEGSVPGLARVAGVSVEDCVRALENLQKPDKYSRSPEHEGRRIEPEDGGWLILNRAKYQYKLSTEDRRERDRIRQQRHRDRAKANDAPDVKPERDMSRVSQQGRGNGKDTTPTTTVPSSAEQWSLLSSEKPGTPSPAKKRRTKAQIISRYSETTAQVVNDLLNLWPTRQPKDGSPIHIDLAVLASRVDDLLRQPDVKPELLVDAAKLYLAEHKNFFKAAQYFVGPGNGEPPPWLAYARMVMHKATQHEPTSQEGMQ